MGISSEQFRAALAQWASGVSVVTARSGQTLAGMTVSAFASASLDPPLITVCLERGTATLALVSATRRFAVNVLSSEQRELSERFALARNETRRFDGVPLLEQSECDSPWLAGALVHLDCRLEATHPAGDHVLCVGAVLLASRHPGQPLIFQASQYHRLAPLAP